MYRSLPTLHENAPSRPAGMLASAGTFCTPSTNGEPVLSCLAQRWPLINVGAAVSERTPGVRLPGEICSVRLEAPAEVSVRGAVRLAPESVSDQAELLLGDAAATGST